METYNGSDQLITETFMIPATGSNSHLRSTPPLEEIEYMGSEVAPEFGFDQGLYYPSAANYYPYYCTGFESPGEWDDHHRFLGVDGQDLHYSGLQTESLPYVYYTPSYGYAQSPYNPYNPYIPGAVIGLDSPFVGTQQYLPSSTYQQPVSSSPYFPVVVQSGSDVPPVGSSDPSLLGAGGSVVNKPNTLAMNYIPSLASGSGAAASQKIASGNLISEPSQSSASQIHSMVKRSEGSLVDVVPFKQSSSRGAMASGVVSQVTQGRNSSGSTQAAEHFMYGRDSSLPNPLKVNVPASNGFTSFGSHLRGWASVDKFRPRFQYSGVLNNVNGSPDILGEQNRGPRTNRSKGPGTSAIAVRAYTTKAGAVNAQGNIIIYAEQYNRDDFPVDYLDAKFFVIKSYSEDDVHKSIKYNVWSSTPNGNKRLDSAYEEAQRISLAKSRKCPVFLFFSVNASGQFCGVAEMVGPVDFGKDMDFWQQDKWTGSFPVKWHIVKDVPNTSFRHIILENNENKPVTNSRDTQEITYVPGISMLSLFKNSPLRTSILDDLMYYEERQKIMYEEKCRLLGRNHDMSFTFAAVGPSNTPISSAEQLPNYEGKAINGSVVPSLNASKEQLNLSDSPPKADSKQVTVDQSLQDGGKHLNFKADQTVTVGGGHPYGTSDQPPKADGKHSNVGVNQPMKADGKQPSIKNNLSANEDEKQQVHVVKKPSKADGRQANGTVNRLKADGKQSKGLAYEPTKVSGHPTKPSDLKTSVKVGSTEKQVTRRLDATNPSIVGKAAGRPNPVEDANSVSAMVKIGSPSIDSKVGEANCSASEVADGAPSDVVTVGSVHIKVKKSGESSSGILTVGSIPIDPKGVKLTNTDGDNARK